MTRIWPEQHLRARVPTVSPRATWSMSVTVKLAKEIDDLYALRKKELKRSRGLQGRHLGETSAMEVVSSLWLATLCKGTRLQAKKV